MNKNELVLQIVKQLEVEAQNMANAARTAHADATGDESKSEHKYDTRGLEASYLAGAQAKLATQIDRNIAAYNNLDLKQFCEDSKIMLTAFVELQSCDEISGFYFLGPNSGGIELEQNDQKIMLITPQSPLGQKLIGRQIGDYFEIKNAETTKGYEVINIC